MIITPPFTEEQKKVIEATEKIIAEQGKVCDVDDDIDEFPKIQAEPKATEDFLPISCYVCNGSGWIAGNGYRHTTKCKRCNGTGKINFYSLTNEDFLRTATTEQLAKFIFWQHFDVYGKTLYELMVNASKGVSRDKQAEVMIGAVAEWLKQPHTFK